MTRYRSRAVLMLFLVLNLTACQTWQSVSLDAISPDQLIEEDRPDRVRVTMQDRTQMELERPAVDGDELVAPASGVSVPLADILRLEVRGFSFIRTVLPVAGLFMAYWAQYDTN